MITSLASDPVYPVADDTVTLSATSDTYPSEDIEYVLTAVPDASALTLGKLLLNGAVIDYFIPDCAGVFTFDCLEFHNLEAQGSFASDPLSQVRHDLKSIESLTVNVGAALDLPIVCLNGHSSTLRLTVVGDYVRAAALVNPATELARVAALDATVALTVNNLVGVAVTALDSSLAANVRPLMTKYAAHIASGPTIHLVADDTNVMIADPPFSDATAISALNELVTRLTAHQRAGTTAAHPWHAEDDTKNMLAVSPVATMLAQATVLCADLRIRVYRPHIYQVTDPDSHEDADTTNDLVVTAKLPLCIGAYLTYVVNNAPTAPTGESEGVGDAQAAFGFRA